jgi:hypothetical protein
MMSKLFVLLFISLMGAGYRQTDPWVPAQLVEPADLAAEINHPSAHPPLVVSVGPSGSIKGSEETGPAKDAANLERLRALLTKVDRNREVIIYCGCCPFARCPNVRPAFALLTEMKFNHARLLNLSHNIKTDWIDHGYPVKEN